MKIKTFLLVAFCMVITSVYSQGKIKKYPFKSGIITYQWEGKIQGTTTVYFDEYGWNEAHYSETTTKMFGIKSEEKKLELFLGLEQYSIDLNTMTGTQMTNPVLESIANDPSADYEKTCEEWMKALGFQKTGTEVVLGKKCDVYEGIGTAWVWKGLSLKVSTNVMGIDATQVASDIKTDVSVPASKFELPEGVKLTEGVLGEGEIEGAEGDPEAAEAQKNLKEMMKMFGGN